MEKHKVYRVIRKAFWPTLSLGLLLVFVVVPIYKVGLWKYASDQREINPFIAKVINRYAFHQSRNLSEDWYNRVEEIRGGANSEGQLGRGHYYFERNQLPVVS